MSGMTSIVKITARIAAIFMIAFGVYLAVVGHIMPGGGLAAGFIIASGFVLLAIAFGKAPSKKGIERIFLSAGRNGSFLFLSFVIFVYSAVYFAMLYFGGVGGWGKLISSGPFFDVLICLAVAAAVIAAFYELSGFRANTKK